MSEIVPGVDTNRFRRGRFATFLTMIKPLSDTGRPVSILDVGGTKAYWLGLRDMWQHVPLEITIVNLGVEDGDEDIFHYRGGNACSLDEFSDNSFDIVHSNSVIEHVGKWAEMKLMAKEVRRLAPRYYLQTPNFWFPMEPHYRTLFFQMVPEEARARMLMKKRRGFRGPYKDLDAAMLDVQSVNLLTAGQLSELFPDARIVKEKFLGLTKSLIALR